jgi:hypothetical protein
MDQPRLDRVSLARLGVELKAEHHRSEKTPLTEQQKDLLLQWAVAEAMTAAQDEVAGSDQSDGKAEGRLPPLELPRPPQPIASAPKAPDGEPPRVLLLYASHLGGWYTGFWSERQWRTHLSADVDLQPTHWLPALPDPPNAPQQTMGQPAPTEER